MVGRIYNGVVGFILLVFVALSYYMPNPWLIWIPAFFGLFFEFLSWLNLVRITQVFPKPIYQLNQALLPSLGGGEFAPST